MARKYHRELRVYIQPTFYLWISVILIIISLRWSVAWLLASFVHEIGHYLAIIALRRNVYGIHLRAASVVFETDIDNYVTDFVCAAAGPFAGLLLVALSPWFPRIAICAAVQSMYNLLPFPNFDGGRMLRSVLSAFLHEKTAARVCHIVAVCFVIAVAGIIVYVGCLIHGIFGALLLGGLLIWKSGLVKIPCKSGKPIVQ